jgi:hypothetical protein
MEHKFQCKNIKEVKEEHRLLASALSERMKTKTMLAILSLFTLILLAMFGYMADAVSDSRDTVARIRFSQNEMKLEIRELQFRVGDVHEEVKEVKETLKENGFSRRRTR